MDDGLGMDVVQVGSEEKKEKKLYIFFENIKKKNNFLYLRNANDVGYLFFNWHRLWYVDRYFNDLENG